MKLGQTETDKKGNETVIKTVDTKDEKGKKAKAVLLDNGEIVIIKKGTGLDAEDALELAGGNKKAYMSAMMSKCVTVSGSHLLFEDFAAYFTLGEYLLVQGAFGEINF